MSLHIFIKHGQFADFTEGTEVYFDPSHLPEQLHIIKDTTQEYYFWLVSFDIKTNSGFTVYHSTTIFSLCTERFCSVSAITSR